MGLWDSSVGFSTIRALRFLQVVRLTVNVDCVTDDLAIMGPTSDDCNCGRMIVIVVAVDLGPLLSKGWRFGNRSSFFLFFFFSLFFLFFAFLGERESEYRE